MKGIFRGNIQRGIFRGEYSEGNIQRGKFRARNIQRGEYSRDGKIQRWEDSERG